MARITMGNRGSTRGLHTSKAQTLDEAFTQFINLCKLRNLSPKTTATYAVHYGIFTKFIDGNSPVTDIDADTIEEFTLYLKEETGIRDVTVNTYLRSIRGFVNYLAVRRYTKRK